MPVPADSSFEKSPAFAGVTMDETILSDAAQQAVIRERRRLAQALHDTLCQSLSGLNLIAILAERKAQAHPDLAGDVAELRVMIRTACDDVHKLVEELRTPPRPAAPTI